MKEVEIYQTVSSVGTFHDRELLGPIFCENNPWLGDGYYFWDSCQKSEKRHTSF